MRRIELWFLTAMIGFSSGCASIDIGYPAGNRCYVVSYQDDQPRVRKVPAQRTVVSGLMPGKYSFFELRSSPFTVECIAHVRLVITSCCEQVSWQGGARSRQVLFDLTTGRLRLPRVLDNDGSTIARIDRLIPAAKPEYDLFREIDPFYRQWVGFARKGSGEHYHQRCILQPGSYRFVIFAEHLNPAWQRNYENLGSEPWRNDWLINWRQEYIDLYTTTFEVPEWKGEPNSEPPVWQVKIDFDVEQGEMSREAEAMTHSQSRQTPK